MAKSTKSYEERMKRSITEKKGCKNRNSQPERIYGLAVSAE